MRLLQTTHPIYLRQLADGLPSLPLRGKEGN